MSNFKNIEKLGLNVYLARPTRGEDIQWVVFANKLESILQSAQVVYGTKYKNTPDESEWATHQLSQDTHSALLVGITPIKKKTKAEEAMELLSKITNDGFHLPNNADIVQQAKRILEMKDEV